MNDRSGKPEPLPYVEESDLLELAADLGPGTFPSSRLYEWHTLTVAGAGRKPVTPKRFGTELRKAGWKNSTRYIDGKMTRCWMITNPWHRKGLEFVNKGADA